MPGRESSGPVNRSVEKQTPLKGLKSFRQGISPDGNGFSSASTEPGLCFFLVIYPYFINNPLKSGDLKILV